MKRNEDSGHSIGALTRRSTRQRRPRTLTANERNATARGETRSGYSFATAELHRLYSASLLGMLLHSLSSSMRVPARYAGGTSRCLCRPLPNRRQPSPYYRWVGFRAPVSCSVFTHVAARMVAEPPKAGLWYRSFRRYRYLHHPIRLLSAGVTVAGWDSYPLRNGAFFRRTAISGLTRRCPNERITAIVAPEFVSLRSPLRLALGSEGTKLSGAAPSPGVQGRAVSHPRVGVGAK